MLLLTYTITKGLVEKKFGLRLNQIATLQLIIQLFKIKNGDLGHLIRTNCTQSNSINNIGLFKQTALSNLIFKITI